MAYQKNYISLSKKSNIMQEVFNSSLNKKEILLIIFLFHNVLVIISMLFLYVYLKQVKINKFFI